MADCPIPSPVTYLPSARRPVTEAHQRHPVVAKRGFWTVFGTATLPTGAPEQSPRDERPADRSKNGNVPMLLPVFGTATLPTGISEQSRRGEVGFWTVFGMGPLSTGASEPSPRGEASPNRSQNGPFPMHQSVFGTESRPTGAPGASSRGKGGFWTVFGTATPPIGAPEASSRGEGGPLSAL